MISCFCDWKFKTDVLLVEYTVYTNILTYVESAIPTWCYSSKYPKCTLANYVS